MTVDKFSGDLVIIDIDGTALAHSTDATLTVTQDAPDTTTKDSAGWKENLIDGNRGWEISASGLVTYDAANTAPHLLLDAILNNAATILKFSTGVVGDEEFTGTAKMTSFSENGPQNAPTSYEITYLGNGPLTKATIV